MIRFSPPSVHDLPEDAARAVHAFPVLVNSVRAVTLAPTLTRPLLDLVTALLTSLELKPRHREMLVLLVSHETNCAYEWVQHLPQARHAGVDTRELAWITHRDAALPPGADRTLLECGRRYLDEGAWSDQEIADLSEHFTGRQIAEILFVLGAYRMFTLYLTALRVETDPAGDALARGFEKLKNAGAR